MEYENKYASKAQSNLNTVLGAIGTVGATGMLGNIGGLFGNNSSNCNRGNAGGCSEDHMINRYEAAQSARIAELETEVKLRDSNIYTDGKILELYKYVDSKFACVENQLCEQRVYNATNTAAISCIQAQVAQLASLTKIVIPNTSICPGWGNVTVAPAAATTAAG